ncbi:ribosome small subunit-dependent GTPase A [candidate division WOR-3 bacterium]|nr:ribosome small subunit-dependent GTPase A [candidate division WOR-3 bacterium]
MHFWDYVLETKFKDAESYCREKNTEIGLVVSQERDRYKVFTKKNKILAEVSGKMEYFAVSPLDFPAVGDIVVVKTCNGESKGIIEEILPRKNYISRKEVTGRKKDENILNFQVIASNVDSVFIVQSLDSNFSPRRVERYLVVIKESKARPIILLSKRDLLSEKEAEEKIGLIIKESPEVKVLAYSAVENTGINEIKSEISAGDVFCMLGSSGAGKSTLINTLLGQDLLEVSEVRSYDSKGRHTTSRRQMMFIDGGSALIDTPGMREIGICDGESSPDEIFQEIQKIAGQCRFADCTHRSEPGCMVRAALENGLIEKKRYDSYLKLNREKNFLAKTKPSARGYKNEREKKIAKISRQRKDFFG